MTATTSQTKPSGDLEYDLLEKLKQDDMEHAQELRRHLQEVMQNLWY